MPLEIRYLVTCVGLLLTALFPGAVAAQNDPAEKKIILIIASYNPDTKRMSDFITEFESEMLKHNYEGDILIEDLGCKGIDEAYQWRTRIEELLGRYKKRELRAVILLGQEAWSAFLMQDEAPVDVPFFVCYGSENGVRLPDRTEYLADWSPASVDMTVRADSMGIAGGYVNVYDVGKNIALIRSLYPDVRQIAFLSDNTYGGVSMQALMRKEMAKYVNLDLILIDTRKNSLKEIQRTVAALPGKTALLIGTWRVDRDGLYFLNRGLTNLLPENSLLPVFSLSGVGIGTCAVGGYVPRYGGRGKQIAKQIHDFYVGQPDSVCFRSGEGYYQFDKNQMKRLGLQEYQLPANSVFVNSLEERIQKYEYYIYLFSGVLLFMSLILLVLYYFNYRNKKLRIALEKREAELIVAKSKAEESDRLKSAFLANMTHEIRTPLNAIVGFSSLLCEDGYSDEEERKEYCSLITRNSNLLLTLVNDVLDISRLETGKVQLVYHETDIATLCMQALTTTSHLRKEGVDYRFKPLAPSFLLETDAQRLSQVLINLISNASKFTQQGQVVLSYELQADQGRVLFSVTDTGTGIPSEMAERIFDRFEKLNEYKQGTGLGLAISRQIVSLLGGEIWVDANYRTGARFVFSHPLTPPKAE